MLHVTLLFNIQMNITLCPILLPVKFHKVRRYYQQLDYLHSSFLPFVLSLLSFWVLFFTAFVTLWWISSLNLLILVTWGTSFPNAVDGDVVWIVFSVTLAVSILFLRTSGVTKTTLSTNLTRPIWTLFDKVWLGTELFLGFATVCFLPLVLFLVVFLGGRGV